MRFCPWGGLWPPLLLLACLPLLAQGTECTPGCHPVNGFCDAPNECRCRSGWQGPLCDQCIPFPGCLHGTCVKAWQCACEEGWIGSRCDTDVHPCASKPCTDNSSACVETGNGGFICLCAEGYAGKSCRVKKGPCIVNGSPCQHGGTCVDGDGSAPHASCLCLPGFTGHFCEIDIDDCEPNPCENGGTCTDIGRGFHCHCPIGFSGALCSSHVSACARHPCQHGGICRAHPSRGFECHCKPHFVGAACAVPDGNKSLDGEAQHRPGRHSHRRVHHKPAHAQERDVLTIKETIENRQPFLNRDQVVCFMVLGLLTCLAVLGTTGIVFFPKFERWLANAKYSQLVRKERGGFLKASEGEHLSVKIIFPDQTEE